ncbi:hypothetical protein EIP91_000927 [Steccherinum ochraceum]|uniref:Ser-Thr-rich glycosyl-phosphatidyl-inositol-anchored membrane family-domain-containing protein n=1 Tax=Steccherinum ochraceum TaxID=92696 RepID=A0A4R0RF29_9APHY|nr:hypothetical protein EIP91_000927 [Steccherinum ochraceum]
MKFTTAFTTFLTCAFATPALFASATPVAEHELVKRVVYSPHITSPTHRTIWQSGQSVNITWDTSDAPPPDQITNRYGKVEIRWDHTATPFLLASGFDILNGWVQVGVPLVETRYDYSIVLYGDGNNASADFEIDGIPSS